jgi:3-oxoacyl-[acyl-carrier protein] reductase
MAEPGAASLAGKTALVTGGSRGIGAAICRDLAAHGAFVYVNFQSSEESAQGVLDAIRAGGGLGELARADVRDADAVAALFDRIRAERGRLDLLVNNAGVSRDAFLGLMSETDWRAVVETHLTGAFLCCRAALRLMVAERAGAIVNVSSVSARAGLPGQCPYASAKAGLLALTHTLAQEVSRYGIRVNAVAPGLVETEMAARIPEAQRRKLVESVPLRRLGRPEEIAAAVRFLLSEDASYIQGQTLVVDGGAIPW